MSLISDALNKAQRDREEPAPPVSRVVHYQPVPERRQASQKRRYRGLATTAGVTAIASTLVGGILYVRRQDSGTNAVPRTIATEASAAVVIPQPAPAPASVKDARPPGEPPRVEAAPTTDYALAGMTVVGPSTLLSISRRSDRRSIWVPVGKTVGEITAISYDENTEQAVIRVNGRTLAVRMRDENPGIPSGVQPTE